MSLRQRDEWKHLAEAQRKADQRKRRAARSRRRIRERGQPLYAEVKTRPYDWAIDDEGPAS